MDLVRASQKESFRALIADHMLADCDKEDESNPTLTLAKPSSAMQLATLDVTRNGDSGFSIVGSVRCAPIPSNKIGADEATVQVPSGTIVWGVTADDDWGCGLLSSGLH